MFLAIGAPLLSLFLQVEPIFTPPLPRRVVRAPSADEQWLQFTVADTPDAAPTDASVSHLKRLWRTQLPEASDGSPVYVRDVGTPSGRRDLLILTTMAGRTVALDARRGTIVWQTEPPAGPQWTTSSPAVDPNLRFVYAYALDGQIHKYRIGSGTEIINSHWPQLVTLKPDVEKGSSALSIATAADGTSYLYMTTAGYPEPDPGDQGDYQGHLVAINLDSGTQNVFNAACSDRAIHFSLGDCPNVQSGIWARAGAVYDEVTDRVYVTTGNGVFDGKTNWGTSVIALRPDGTTDGGVPLDSYTPSNFQNLTDIDADLGSTTVAVLPNTGANGTPRIAMQSGKDGRLRFLDLRHLGGMGGELNEIDVPQGGPVFTRPATWIDALGRTWVFIANNRGVSGSIFLPDKMTLRMQWSVTGRAVTPVIVNGVLYVPADHRISALDPLTGETLWEDTSIGTSHWASPIAVDDKVFIADGDGGVTAFGF